jgi:hypothetical protein
MNNRKPPSTTELSSFRIKIFNNFFERNYGRWRSNKIGDGSEFHALSEYRYGDSYKKINWLATARTDKLITNQTIAERSSRYHIIINATQTMNFGSIRRKSDIVTELLKTILDLVASTQDSIKITVIGENVINYPLKNGKAATLFYKNIISKISYEKIEANGAFYKNYKNKESTVVIFISDFLDSEAFINIEKFIINNNVLPIHIYDPNEYLLPQVGIFKLKAYGSNNTYIIDTKDKKFISKNNALVIEYKNKLNKLLQLSRYGISLSTTDDHAGKQFISKINKKSAVYAN